MTDLQWFSIYKIVIIVIYGPWRYRHAFHERGWNSDNLIETSFGGRQRVTVATARLRGSAYNFRGRYEILTFFSPLLSSNSS